MVQPELTEEELYARRHQPDEFSELGKLCTACVASLCPPQNRFCRCAPLPHCACTLISSVTSNSMAQNRPWRLEYSDPNGRGLAVVTAFLLGVALGVAVLTPLLLPSATPFFVYFA